jgi:Tat protein translocase TatB subunit
MFGVGSGEVVLIILVAIIVLGPKRLPEFARSLGKLIANLRAATSELKKNLEQEIGVDELSKLNPRKIADDIIAGQDISDIHPAKYIKKTVEKAIQDPYTEAPKEKLKQEDKKTLKKPVNKIEETSLKSKTATASGKKKKTIQRIRKTPKSKTSKKKLEN